MTTQYFGVDPQTPYSSLPSSGTVSGAQVPIHDFYTIQRQRLTKFGEQYMATDHAPVVTLISAGSTTATPQVVATRRGFQDFRRMMVINQFYKYSGRSDALSKLKSMVIDWAATNVPDGHPINQTHFEGMHRVIQERWVDFSTSEQSTITTWLNANVSATEAWVFPAEPGGGTLIYGNHYTHHYKQLLMCYLSLGDTAKFDALLTSIDQHAIENFPFGNPAVTYPMTHVITAVDKVAGWVKIAGTDTWRFPSGHTLTIAGSTGNDGAYTVLSAVVSGTDTQITLQETLASNVADGSLVEDYSQSVHHMPRAATHPGESIDRIRRDALHYHVYDVEPWLEIALMTGSRYQALMGNAWQFLLNSITSTTRHYEFTNSVDNFDQLRWEGSHPEYLAPNSRLVLDIHLPRLACTYWHYSQTLGTYSEEPNILSIVARSPRGLTSFWFYWFRWCLGL